MTTLTSLEHDVVAAAQQAAALVPASAPLSALGPVDLSRVAASIPPDAVAVRADALGARNGVVVVVAEQSLAAVLEQSPMGPLPLGEALRPALEALRSTLGVGAIGPISQTTAAQALGALTGSDAVVVPLTGADGSRAWLAVSAMPSSGPVGASSGSVNGAGLELLQDVVMELSAELGRTRMTVRDLLNLQPGAVVELDRLAGSPADLLVNGRLIARGEVVVVDEDYALKITELVSGSMQEHA